MFSLTPYRELRLLREGNAAAATVLAGEMLALAVPLAAMLAHSANVPDILLWGAVTIIRQWRWCFASCRRRSSAAKWRRLSSWPARNSRRAF
jgi:uncharacterized membrane protein YjfL (UPF0719 family)